LAAARAVDAGEIARQCGDNDTISAEIQKARISAIASRQQQLR